MVNYEVFNRRKANLMRLDHCRRHIRNVINFSLGSESLAHATKKLEVCYYLKELGVEFVTEAIFEKGCGRADIFVLDNDVAIEILGSEKEANLELKANKYPCRVVGVKLDLKLDVDIVEKLVS